jgi:hypothetical protein
MATRESQTEEPVGRTGAGDHAELRETNAESEILNDEERATEVIARASLEVLKQASKILVPPTL